MKKTFFAAALILTFALAFPLSAQDEALTEVSITATIRTYVLDAPRPNAELVGILQAGAELSAYGRDAGGNWLRIMEGWVLGEVFNTEGEVGALRDTTHSFLGFTNAHTFLYDGPSERWFNSLAGMGEGTRILIIGRNEDSSWLQDLGGWINAAHVESDGDVSRLPVTPSGVIITAKTRTFILKEPDLSAEFVDVFEKDQQALAIGRNGNKTWLEIAVGWLPVEAVDISGELSALPFTGDGVLVTSKNSHAPFRSRPAFGATELGTFPRGKTSFAIGRNAEGSWLLLTNEAWVYAGSVKSDGNIMVLPIVSDTEAESESTRSTLTESKGIEDAKALDTRAIRTLIARHTDDIRILDLATSSAATTIEYDLKPWPFVPNESIANEVAFKIICAIRNGQSIPNTLKFIGHTHFKSEVGRKFTGPSVEMHISASNANRIVCRGNDPSDINWRRLASRYKSYPIPRGASIDYD